MLKRTKYGNKKTTVYGIEFDSRKEATRYCELRLLQEAGKISDLKLQVPFPVVINGKPCFKYVADFTYTENGRPIVEDVKGMKTQVYRLKKKVVEALYGFSIRET